MIFHRKLPAIFEETLKTKECVQIDGYLCFIPERNFYVSPCVIQCNHMQRMHKMQPAQ